MSKTKAIVAAAALMVLAGVGVPAWFHLEEQARLDLEEREYSGKKAAEFFAGAVAADPALKAFVLDWKIDPERPHVLSVRVADGWRLLPRELRTVTAERLRYLWAQGQSYGDMESTARLLVVSESWRTIGQSTQNDPKKIEFDD